MCVCVRVCGVGVQESGRHWEEVRGGWALFDRKDRVAAALKGATLPQCVAFFETHLRPGAPTRRKVRLTRDQYYHTRPLPMRHSHTNHSSLARFFCGAR